ncbi:MAG: hypothetical protein ACFCBV_07310 [Phycisphaerales bacterium]
MKALATRVCRNTKTPAAAGLLAIGSAAHAAPPAVGALELPVDLASIVVVAVAALGAMLVIMIGPSFGGAAVRGLLNWGKSFARGRG